jgi:hypothetical protein
MLPRYSSLGVNLAEGNKVTMSLAPSPASQVSIVEDEVPPSTGGNDTIDIFDEIISDLADALAEDMANAPDSALLYDPTHDQARLADEARRIVRRVLMQGGDPSAKVLRFPASYNGSRSQPSKIMSFHSVIHAVVTNNVVISVVVILISVAVAVMAFSVNRAATAGFASQSAKSERPVHLIHSVLSNGFLLSVPAALSGPTDANNHILFSKRPLVAPEERRIFLKEPDRAAWIDEPILSATRTDGSSPLALAFFPPVPQLGHQTKFSQKSHSKSPRSPTVLPIVPRLRAQHRNP